METKIKLLKKGQEKGILKQNFNFCCLTCAIIVFLQMICQITFGWLAAFLSTSSRNSDF